MYWLMVVPFRLWAFKMIFCVCVESSFMKATWGSLQSTSSSVTVKSFLSVPCCFKDVWVSKYIHSFPQSEVGSWSEKVSRSWSDSDLTSVSPAALFQTTGLVGLAVSHNPHEVSSWLCTHHTAPPPCPFFGFVKTPWLTHSIIKTIKSYAASQCSCFQWVTPWQIHWPFFHPLCPSSQRLRILYSKILASLQTMPQDAAYRKYTEQLVSERFNHVKTVSDRLFWVRMYSVLGVNIEDGGVWIW